MMDPTGNSVEPNVITRLRAYEGKSMDVGYRKPTNPNITSREAIVIADYIAALRQELDFLGQQLDDCRAHNYHGS